jgi:hypothetical protein
MLRASSARSPLPACSSHRLLAKGVKPQPVTRDRHLPRSTIPESLWPGRPGDVSAGVKGSLATAELRALPANCSRVLRDSASGFLSMAV